MCLGRAPAADDLRSPDPNISLSYYVHYCYYYYYCYCYCYYYPYMYITITFTFTITTIIIIGGRPAEPRPKSLVASSLSTYNIQHIYVYMCIYTKERKRNNK